MHMSDSEIRITKNHFKLANIEPVGALFPFFKIIFLFLNNIIKNNKHGAKFLNKDTESPSN